MQNLHDNMNTMTKEQEAVMNSVLNEEIEGEELEREDCPICGGGINFWRLQDELDQLSFCKSEGLKAYQRLYNMKDFNPETWECEHCGRKMGERYTVRNRMIYRSRTNNWQ